MATRDSVVPAVSEQPLEGDDVARQADVRRRRAEAIDVIAEGLLELLLRDHAQFERLIAGDDARV